MCIVLRPTCIKRINLVRENVFVMIMNMTPKTGTSKNKATPTKICLKYDCCKQKPSHKFHDLLKNCQMILFALKEHYSFALE